jgi:hypothetical protein
LAVRARKKRLSTDRFEILAGITVGLLPTDIDDAWQKLTTELIRPRSRR